MCRGVICKLSLTMERVEGDWHGDWRVESSPATMEEMLGR